LDRETQKVKGGEVRRKRRRGKGDVAPSQ